MIIQEDLISEWFKGKGFYRSSFASHSSSPFSLLVPFVFPNMCYNSKAARQRFIIWISDFTGNVYSGISAIILSESVRMTLCFFRFHRNENMKTFFTNWQSFDFLRVQPFYLVCEAHLWNALECYNKFCFLFRWNHVLHLAINKDCLQLFFFKSFSTLLFLCITSRPIPTNSTRAHLYSFTLDKWWMKLDRRKAIIGYFLIKIPSQFHYLRAPLSFYFYRIRLFTSSCYWM